jgi:hypothetical protein
MHRKELAKAYTVEEELHAVEELYTFLQAVTDMSSFSSLYFYTSGPVQDTELISKVMQTLEISKPGLAEILRREFATIALKRIGELRHQLQALGVTLDD